MLGPGDIFGAGYFLGAGGFFWGGGFFLGGGGPYPILFLHESPSKGQIRLRPKFHRPSYSRSWLKAWDRK